jgi:hypothetical protein
MLEELPMCCRRCASKESAFVYPAWTHKCLKAKPMVEGCRWRSDRRLTLKEERNERPNY